MTRITPVSSAAADQHVCAMPEGPRRLEERDRPAVLAHLQRLGDEDRRLRFLQTTTDEMLQAYVSRLCFDSAPCFGFFDAAGSLIALAEGLPDADEELRSLEAAFTTDAGWRRRGLASTLFDTLKQQLAARGGSEIVLHCDARNRPMRGLLLRVDAVIEVDGSEVHAVWRPLPTTEGC